MNENKKALAGAGTPTGGNGNGSIRRGSYFLFVFYHTGDRASSCSAPTSRRIQRHQRQGTGGNVRLQIPSAAVAANPARTPCWCADLRRRQRR